jgi:hypothetical protein
MAQTEPHRDLIAGERQLDGLSDDALGLGVEQRRSRTAASRRRHSCGDYNPIMTILAWLGRSLALGVHILTRL